MKYLKIFLNNQAFKLNNTICKGASSNKSEDIKIIQNALDLLLPDEVIDNGHYGAYTEKLVKSFQEKCGVSNNGIIDENCWQHIKCLYYFNIFCYLNIFFR